MELKIGRDRDSFYQWDTGQFLIVDGADACNEVHFSNKQMQAALVCKIRAEDGQRVADVPNILLQAATMVTAYLSCYAEDGSETRYAKSFQVHHRPKPETYVYTETETLNYAYLDNRLTDLEGEGLAKAVADYMEENPIDGSGWTAIAKTLLINILRNAVYSTDQSANITALEKFFASSGGNSSESGGDSGNTGDGGEVEATLSNILVSYEGGDVGIGTALTDLTDITVLAVYSDGSTETVTGYTLSGEIVEGENTITVTYEGLTATFTVTGYDASLEVIALAPYLKKENYYITTVYDGTVIRTATQDGTNIYSVPVEAGITYRLGYTHTTNYEGRSINNGPIKTIGTARLPVLSADTDLSTESITHTLAESVTNQYAVDQGDGTYLYAVDIVFATDGYFLFSIQKASDGWTFAKVVA